MEQRFAGRVAPEDIWRYYADADVYLQTPDIDNMPSSVLEAFASGCAVVSTNALELGVDIGQLQACVLNGYPGTVASMWQQAGRAGRRHSEALVIFVASSSSLDQLVAEQPDLILDRSPEAARLDPNNLIILVDHMKCAAFELPFQKGERFGTVAFGLVFSVGNQSDLDALLSQRLGKIIVLAIDSD